MENHVLYWGNRISRKELWIHVLIWLFLFSFSISVSLIEFGTIQVDLLIRVLVTLSIGYLNYLILAPYLLLKKKIVLYILASIFALVVFNYFITSFAPIAALAKYRNILEKQDYLILLKLKFLISIIITFSFYILGGALRIAKEVYIKQKVSDQIKIQKTETELEFLRAQLNPHFLFNCLNSLYSLVRNNSKEAPEAVIRLSELMRYMLYEAREDRVYLAREFEFLKNYIYLQLLRFSNNGKVRLNVPNEFVNYKIPPLLLIPFVENAFKHGADSGGQLEIELNIILIENAIFFEIKNKIGVQRYQKSNSGIGLQNTKNRLDLLYPNEYIFDIQSFNGYFIVKLELMLTE